jgi:predicted transcriptional regulator
MPRQLRHRSRSEIISSILEVTNGNKVRITEIQFKTYLAHNILKEYLVHLLQNDLIEYIEGERAFKTTPKGMQAFRKPRTSNLPRTYGCNKERSICCFRN